MLIYKILEINIYASADEIKKAWRNKSRLYHPDLSKDPFGDIKQTIVNLCYEFIENTESRNMYVTINTNKNYNADMSKINKILLDELINEAKRSILQDELESIGKSEVANHNYCMFLVKKTIEFTRLGLNENLLFAFLKSYGVYKEYDINEEEVKTSNFDFNTSSYTDSNYQEFKNYSRSFEGSNKNISGNKMNIQVILGLITLLLISLLLNYISSVLNNRESNSSNYQTVQTDYGEEDIDYLREMAFLYPELYSSVSLSMIEGYGAMIYNAESQYAWDDTDYSNQYCVVVGLTQDVDYSSDYYFSDISEMGYRIDASDLALNRIPVHSSELEGCGLVLEEFNYSLSLYDNQLYPDQIKYFLFKMYDNEMADTLELRYNGEIIGTINSN